MKYLSIFSFVLLSSIVQSQNNYLLNIHIEGAYKGNLYLSNNTGGYDSTNVVNGKATFRGIKDKPAQVGIILQGYSNVGWVFLENATIDVYCKYIESDAVKHHMIKIDTIIGSKSQADLYEFDKLYGKYKSSNSPTWEFDLIKYTSSFSKPVAEWALFRLADNLENKQIEALIKMIGKENLSAKTLKWWFSDNFCALVN